MASDAAGAASAASATCSAVGGRRQATREQRRGQCVEVRLARERHVQRLESACRREQQWRRVAPAVGRERDPRPEDLCLGPLEVVERADLGILEKGDGVVDGACLVLRLGGRQRPAGASRGLDGQRRRTFEECRGGGEPATRLGARSGTFQVRGDIFVRHHRGLRSVPGATIRVGLGIRRVRERLMDLGPLDGVGGSIHRGANERMPEGDARPERDQSARLRREGRRLRDPETLGSPPHERRVPGRFARGDEDQQARVTRKRSHAPLEALLDPGVNGRRRRHAEAAREL